MLTYIHKHANVYQSVLAYICKLWNTHISRHIRPTYDIYTHTHRHTYTNLHKEYLGIRCLPLIIPWS